jgi:hypothetical protein
LSVPDDIFWQAEVYLCEFRAQLASDLEEYESGRRTTGMLCNGLRYDDTRNRIAEIKRRLTKADNLIATCAQHRDA